MHRQRKKYIRANHTSFVTKSLRKAIIVRSRLRNIFLKEKSLESKKAYIKQRNICVSMIEEVKKEHFQKINLSEITDIRKFWKTVGSLFDNRVNTSQKINVIGKTF